MNLPNVPQVETGASIRTALLQLESLNVGALLVMNAGEMIGIVSERDFTRSYAQTRGKLKTESKVDSIMTTEVACVTCDHRLDECLNIMAKKNVRHLPVLEEGVPIALLSMKHIMEAIIGDKDFLIQEMTKYVTGSNYLNTRLHHGETTK
jgi:CBS domain-containing protein